MTESQFTPSYAADNQVLVAGATGDLGGAVTRILLSQGKSVRVLVRQNSKYQPLADAGAQIVYGDLKNRASLDPACKGIQIVITTANSAKRGGDDNPKTVDLEGNRNLIDAAKAAGVQQFIFVSAHMADPKSPVPFVQAKGKTEEYLRESGIPYTIIAPDAFMDVWVAMIVSTPATSGHPVTLVGEGSRKHSFISSTDVANMIVASTGNPKAINQRFIIGGPEAISFRDAARILEERLGHLIPLKFVQIGQPLPGLPESMQGMAAALEMYDSPIDMSKITQDFSLKLTSARDFFRGVPSAPMA